MHKMNGMKITAKQDLEITWIILARQEKTWERTSPFYLAKKIAWKNRLYS